MWQKLALAGAMLMACAPAHAAQLILGLSPNATQVAPDAPQGTVVATLTIALNNGKPFTGTVQLVHPAFTMAANNRDVVVSDTAALAALDGQTVTYFIRISQ